MADVGPEDSAPTLSIVTEDDEGETVEPDESSEAITSLGTAEDINALTGLVRGIRELLPAPAPPAPAQPQYDVVYCDLSELTHIAAAVTAFSEAIKPIREPSVGHTAIESWEPKIAWPLEKVKARYERTLLKLADVADFVIDQYKAAVQEASKCDD